MAFPTGWSRKCALVIQSSQVASSLTNFPLLLTEDTLPSEMFDADGTYPAQSGGGDIRFSSDLAGSTQLACEIVTFTTDNDPANGVAEIWVNVPSISSSTNTTIHVWYNTTGTDSQPAVTDTYGRNAVWSDYWAVFHGNDLTNSTGGNDLAIGVDTNLPDSGYTTQTKIGDSYNFDDSNTEAYQVAGSPFSGSSPRALQCWARNANTSIPNTQYLIALGNNLVFGDGYRLGVDDSPKVLRIEGSGGYELGSTDVLDQSWHKIDAVMSSGTDITDTVLYLNGSAETVGASSSITLDTDGPTYVGSRYNVNSNSTQWYWDGQIDEIRIRDANVSSLTGNWLSAEYNNQNSPSTFVVEGTPENVSGAIEASVGVALQQGVVSSRTALYEASANIAIEQSAVNTRLATLSAAVSVGIQQLIDQDATTAAQIIEASLQVGLQQAILSQASAIFEASTSIDSQQAAISGGLATLSASVALGIDQTLITDGTIVTGPITFEAALSVGVVQSIDAVTVANLYAATSLGHQTALTLSGGSAISAAVAYGIQHSYVTSAEITIEGQVAAGLNQAININVQSTLNVQTTIAHQAALQAIAGAVLEAGLDLSAIQSITTQGFTLVVGIVTPDCRTFTITVQDSTANSGDEDRTFNIPEC